uniref:Uncharacterized protein n=1 Tax=Rhizophagus irregularis (strain DAOM 181602 / DAOM 197198 / MUCL 43194) TaxID=747089 RepID=U9TBT7_RHIID
MNQTGKWTPSFFEQTGFVIQLLDRRISKVQNAAEIHFENSKCHWTSILKVKEAERQVPDSHIKGPGFPFKELQR